jgi:hypothetical protein
MTIRNLKRNRESSAPADHGRWSVDVGLASALLLVTVGCTSTPDSKSGPSGNAKVTPNRLPAALSQRAMVTAGNSVRITLGGRAVEGAPLSFGVVAQPQQGRLAGRAPELKYEAEPTARGTDQFTFKVNDGHKDSAEATVTITIQPVNRPPVALNRTVVATAGEETTITLKGIDSEGGPLSYAVVAQPQQGKLTGRAPRLRYKAGPTARGSDSFTFKVHDGQLESAEATVSITIRSLNHTPGPAVQNVKVPGGEPNAAPLTAPGPGESLRAELACLRVWFNTSRGKEDPNLLVPSGRGYGPELEGKKPKLMPRGMGWPGRFFEEKANALRSEYQKLGWLTEEAGRDFEALLKAIQRWP